MSFSQYNLITADKGAVQLNDKRGTWRKEVPTEDNQVLVSDSSLDKGAEWRSSLTLPIDQTQVMCTEIAFDGFFAGTQVDNWNPAGLSTASVITIQNLQGQLTITGIDRSVAQQCQIILYNDTIYNIKLDAASGASLPGNRFSFNVAQLVLQPKEAANLYYNKTINAYMLVSHL